MILMLLRFPQKICSTSKLEVPSSAEPEGQPIKKETDLAVRLINELVVPGKPQEFYDEYREASMEHVENKFPLGVR